MDADSKKIVFLCSGGGGNLSFILEATRRGWVNGSVVAVVTDRRCQANVIAEKNSIFTLSVDFAEAHQDTLTRELGCHQPDVIITTVHKILRPNLLKAYPEKFVNLHYSLLPSFGGTIGDKPVQAALKYGARLVGATAHYVDESVDGGPPISQVAIPVFDEATDASGLMDLVFRCGCLTLLSAVEEVLTGRRFPQKAAVLSYAGRPCLFSGLSESHVSLDDEKFWSQIKERSKV